MRCGLCLGDVEALCQSHIIPEHVYKNDMYKVVGGTRRCYGYVFGEDRPRYMQGGVKENLLCKCCERLLIDKYESTFSNFWYKDGLFSGAVTSELHVLTVNDYLAFKLYHLSVLYRCIISSSMNGNGLSLGAHHEDVRKSVLNGYDFEMYDLFGFVLVDGGRRIQRKIIIHPEMKRFNGAVTYVTVYAGCAWCIRVASHRDKDVESISLNNSGLMTLPVLDYRELSAMRSYSKFLKKSG